MVERIATLGSGSATWGQTPPGGARPSLAQTLPGGSRAKWHALRVPFGREAVPPDSG